MSNQSKPSQGHQDKEQEDDQTDALGFSFRKSKPELPVPKKSNALELPGQSFPVVQDVNEDYYKTTHTNRGIAVIFNHYKFDNPSNLPRTGTEKDCEKVEKTFERLGFKTIVHHDLKYGRITDELKIVSQMDHTENDCLVVVVMTHGEPDHIYARDEIYPTATLWEPFTGEKCATLVGKPKLFFIQACRGTKADEGVKIRREIEFDSIPHAKPTMLKIPKMADLLVMYATYPDNFSFRSPRNGSWFIQTLCDVLEKRAKDMDLYGILTIVNRTMAFAYVSHVPNDRELNDKKQIGQIVSTLTRLLHFYKQV